MAALPELAVTVVSRWYRSEPVPRSEQPDYVNGCIRLDATHGASEPEPEDMLAILQRIEQAHGRQRSIANAARTLDLDIIAMGSGGALVRDRPDPVLPHPRTHLRAFVLLPLRDVAPHWVDPRSGLTIDRLIEALPPADLAPDRISAI